MKWNIIEGAADVLWPVMSNAATIELVWCYTVQEVVTLIYAIVMALTVLLTLYTKEGLELLRIISYIIV